MSVCVPVCVSVCFSSCLSVCLSVGYQSEMDSLQLDAFDTTCIAATLKKFLRELSNPVIPEELYTDFVNAASKCGVATETTASICY